MRLILVAMLMDYLVFAAFTCRADTVLTIATVNNGDMIRMQNLSSEFLANNPDIHLRWVTLDENVLRQRVTTDVVTKGGQFDIVTIGTYEIPIWAKRGWLEPLTHLGPDYDVEDLLPKIRDASSVSGKLYGAPFYGESSMIMYRSDLFRKASLTMPDRPTWDFIQAAAGKLTDKSAGIYGICLRGKPGWGENIGLLTAMSNSYGARWFDENWQPQFDKPEWRKTLQTYVAMLQQFGPPGASTNGFNENLTLFDTGRCAMWFDATVAGSFVANPKESRFANSVAFAFAPNAGLSRNASWLWAWTLAIPSGSKNTNAAQRFIAWATSKEYAKLVASKQGWINAPPGTRASLYRNTDYTAVAPFAKITLESINLADSSNPSVLPVPYVGVQYVAIPEFQGIGAAVGQQFAAALTGSISVEAALTAAQSIAEREMKRAGYLH